MEKISIICLLYQSTEYGEFVYNNLLKYTPELNSGVAEFYFIANDASDEVLKFLKEKNYKHYINNNKFYSENELFKMGYAYPEYINRVYAGYNYGIKKSKNEIVCLINSDNAFSPNWLINLKNKLTYKTAVSSRMIQPHKKFKNPKNNSYSEQYNFGETLKVFNEENFLKKVNEISKNTISMGNPFMPVMIHKSNIEKVGYYPEGNIANGNYNTIKYTGDHELFNKLEKIGINHITVDNSIIYHFQEGEKKNKI